MRNFLKFFLYVIVVVGVSTAAEANLIRLPFSTTVTPIPGSTLSTAAFGIVTVPGVTRVRGFVLYDPSVTPRPDDFVANEEIFDFSIMNGLSIKIGNTIITSSDYSILTANHIVAFAGAGDHLLATSESLIMNGVTFTTGGITLDFINSDDTLFSNRNLDVLPSRQTVALKIDDFGGVLGGPERTENGSGATALGFGNLSGFTAHIPDTGTTLLLLALGFAPVALLYRVRGTVRDCANR